MVDLSRISVFAVRNNVFMQYKHATTLLLLTAIGTAILTIAVFERREALQKQLNDTGPDTDMIERMSQPLGDGEYRETDVDLDGDGVFEHVALTLAGTDEEGFGVTLTINDDSVIVPNMSNPEGFFGIVDVNQADPQKQIAISDLGSSSDFTTAFYEWRSDDVEPIVYSGTTSDLWRSIRIDGDGTIVAEKRAMILDTWFYYATYEQSSENRMITESSQDFYARTRGSEVVVTALRPMTFQTSSTDATIAMTLETGDQGTMIGCDTVTPEEGEEWAIGWCAIWDTATPPNVGWFRSDAIDMQNDFAGFSFAD
jgi:hypothetical protein